MRRIYQFISKYILPYLWVMEASFVAVAGFFVLGALTWTISPALWALALVVEMWGVYHTVQYLMLNAGF